MKNYNKGEKVSIKRCYEVHINGYITDVCPGEVGTVHWDCGDTVEVYFGDYIMLEVNKEDIEPCISEETEEVTNVDLKDALTGVMKDGNSISWYGTERQLIDLVIRHFNRKYPDSEVTITIKPKKQ